MHRNRDPTDHRLQIAGCHPENWPEALRRIPKNNRLHGQFLYREVKKVATIPEPPRGRWNQKDATQLARHHIQYTRNPSNTHKQARFSQDGRLAEVSILPCARTTPLDLRCTTIHHPDHTRLEQNPMPIQAISLTALVRIRIVNRIHKSTNLTTTHRNA
jgi:hypothetical protein